MPQKHIFFAAYGGGHAPAVIPVIKELKARGHHTTFLALTTAKKVAQDEGVDYITIHDAVDMQDAQIRYWGQKLAAIHHTDGKGLSYEESIAYLGTSFCDLALDIGEDSAWKQYKEKGLNAFCPTRTIKQILKQQCPDAVIATTSPRSEKATLRAAHDLGIPSLCMVELFGILESSWLCRPDNGDYLAVSRPDVISRLCDAGRSAERIIMTGSPMFDVIADKDFIKRGIEWRAKHALKETDKLVFWAEQPEPDAPEMPRDIRQLLAEICSRNGWKLAVRLHPSSTNAADETIPDGVLESSAEEALHDVLSACDVCVTLTSTVGWEALLADKPLVVARVSAYSNMVTYGEGDGALAVDHIEEMESALLTVLNDTAQYHELERLRRELPAAGGAAARVSDLIETQLLKLGNS